MATILLLVFPALMAFAASSDLLTMTISNRVSLALVAGFSVLAFVAGMGLETVGYHVLAGGLVLAASFTCFAFGWIGGGDAKLAAATALWFGFGHLLDYLVLASLIGGALTLAIIRFRTLPLAAALARQPWLARLHDRNTGVPYGIALAGAALLIYPHTEWMALINS